GGRSEWRSLSHAETRAIAATTRAAPPTHRVARVRGHVRKARPCLFRVAAAPARPPPRREPRPGRDGARANMDAAAMARRAGKDEAGADGSSAAGPCLREGT